MIDIISKQEKNLRVSSEKTMSQHQTLAQETVSKLTLKASLVTCSYCPQRV